MRLKTINIFAISLLILGTISCSRTTNKTVKIGVVIPLTGEYADYGKNIQHALNIGIEKISKEKNRFHYELIYEDGQANPKMAVSAIKKLIYINHVKYIIGGFTSACSVAIYPIAAKNKIIMFSPSSSTPVLSKNTPYFFRNWPSDEIQAKKFADYTFNKFHERKVATIYSLSDYGVFANKVFCQQFEKLGGKVLGQHGYTPNTTEFRTIVTKLIDEKPQAVWLFGYYNEMGPFLKQAKMLGLKTQFFGQEGIESQQLLKVAGDAANGLIYFVPFFNPDAPQARQFTELYEKKYRKQPEVFGAHAYDVLNIYHELIEKYGNNPEIIKNQILKIKDYNGVSGLTSFDKEGNAFQPLMIKMIKKGQFINYAKK